MKAKTLKKTNKRKASVDKEFISELRKDMKGIDKLVDRSNGGWSISLSDVAGYFKEKNKKIALDQIFY